MGLDPLRLTLFYKEVNQSMTKKTLSYILEQGCRTQPEGVSENYSYLGPHSDYDSMLTDRATAERYLADRGGGISFWYRDYNFMLWTVPQQFQNYPPHLSLSIDETHFVPYRLSNEAIEQRALQMTELVGGIIEETHPAVGYGAIGEHIDDEGASSMISLQRLFLTHEPTSFTGSPTFRYRASNGLVERESGRHRHGISQNSTREALSSLRRVSRCLVARPNASRLQNGSDSKAPTTGGNELADPPR